MSIPMSAVVTQAAQLLSDIVTATMPLLQPRHPSSSVLGCSRGGLPALRDFLWGPCLNSHPMLLELDWLLVFACL